MTQAGMISGYGGKEREFLDALKADTGRTLDEWMQAIADAGLSERNDIIDWLRRQGFRFSRASWLERVHHNGGKPIYGGAVAPERTTMLRATRPPRDRSLGKAALPASPPPSTPTRVAPAAAPTPRPAADFYALAAGARPASTSDPMDPAIAQLTAKAKAYRPLAEFLLREIAKAVPDATYAVRGQQVVMIASSEFAILAVSPRELKLSLPGGALSLTDARQIDAALIARIRQAALSP